MVRLLAMKLGGWNCALYNKKTLPFNILKLKDVVTR